jgi:soluble lytic murein transglycosylase
MQMLPSTARETARRAGVSFDERRLLTDPAFNAQLGAAHLGELLTAQQGSYILTFAAYNAGPGRVKQWLAAYGDPRDPQVDPIDWIERIPFSETRDYVQKILENLQIYRVRLGQSDGVSLGEDLRRVRRAAIVAP